jgi:hypothetical protein
MSARAHDPGPDQRLMLQFVIDAIAANPAVRFQITTDDAGARWLEIRMPHEPARGPSRGSIVTKAGSCVVA